MSTEQRQNDSLLMELVKDVPIEFVKTRIVITSCPNACQELKANRTIEIIGLGDKEIMEFVQNSFPGDAQSVEAFMIQLDEYPLLCSNVACNDCSYLQVQTAESSISFDSLYIVMTLIREEKRNRLHSI